MKQGWWIIGVWILLVVVMGVTYVKQHKVIISERFVVPTISVNKPSPTPTPLVIKSILFEVPFTSQAPNGEWNDTRHQDGCEETASLMAYEWVKGNKNTKIDKKEAVDTIRKIWDFEVNKWGSGVDTSASDTAKRILKDYFMLTKVEVKNVQNANRVIEELMRGNLVVVPTNGRLLKNPNFTGLGPERHMVVIRGYDLERREFITNDPGTRKGELYRYPEEVMFEAIADYPTGDHEPTKTRDKNMIVVSR
jgi:hypothetical protein